MYAPAKAWLVWGAWTSVTHNTLNWVRFLKKEEAFTITTADTYTSKVSLRLLQVNKWFPFETCWSCSVTSLFRVISWRLFMPYALVFKWWDTVLQWVIVFSFSYIVPIIYLIFRWKFYEKNSNSWDLFFNNVVPLSIFIKEFIYVCLFYRSQILFSKITAYIHLQLKMEHMIHYFCVVCFI